jgi:flagellar assembly protein FliH
MASRVIPKEQLTAYQRWELATVENTSPLQPGRRGAEVAVNLPTAEDLQRIQQDAWQEGNELGLKEGREKGYQEGIKAAQDYIQRLAHLVEALDGGRMLQEEAIAREILNLALMVARQILRTTVEVKEGVVVAAIKDAFASLPSLTGHLRVVVNPADAGDIRRWLSADHSHIVCKVQEDPGMARGSFRFENDHSILHGELAERWRAVVESLGSDLEWLE